MEFVHSPFKFFFFFSASEGGNLKTKLNKSFRRFICVLVMMLAAEDTTSIRAALLLPSSQFLHIFYLNKLRLNRVTTVPKCLVSFEPLVVSSWLTCVVTGIQYFI